MFMTNKLNGLKADYIVIDEFKKINNKQGENKMTVVKGSINFGGWGITSDGKLFTDNNHSKNPYWPKKVIHNDHTVIVYFENGDKRVVTCSVEDDFNMEFGFLLALAHEVFGSKDKYRTMYTKKVDKKAYPKMKNKEKLVVNGGISTNEVTEIVEKIVKKFHNKVE